MKTRLIETEFNPKKCTLYYVMVSQLLRFRNQRGFGQSCGTWTKRRLRLCSPADPGSTFNMHWFAQMYNGNILLRSPGWITECMWTFFVFRLETPVAALSRRAVTSSEFSPLFLHPDTINDQPVLLQTKSIITNVRFVSQASSASWSSTVNSSTADNINPVALEVCILGDDTQLLFWDNCSLKRDVHLSPSDHINVDGWTRWRVHVCKPALLNLRGPTDIRMLRVTFEVKTI